jgi:polyphenol oxidase
MLLNLDLCSIFFGDAQDSLIRNEIGSHHKVFEKLKKKLAVSELVFANQVHGIDGIVVDKYFNSFTYDADFLITNKKNIGIGVLTADCLPIVIVDEIKKVVCVIHAGWRGSEKKIGIHAIKKMQTSFGCDIKNLKIYFGSCAKKCCYEVGEDFVKNFEDLNSCFSKIKDKLFFDLVEFNKRQLCSFGVSGERVCDKSCTCTICNKNFCSFRRDNNFAREITIVFLK